MQRPSLSHTLIDVPFTFRPSPAPFLNLLPFAIAASWHHGNWTSDRKGEPDLDSVMRRRIVYKVKEPRKEGKKMVDPAPPFHKPGRHGKHGSSDAAPGEVALLAASRRPLAEQSTAEDLGLPARLKRPPGQHAAATSGAHYELLAGRSVTRVSDPRGGVPVTSGGDKPYKNVEASPGWRPVLSSEPCEIWEAREGGFFVSYLISRCVP